MLSRLVITFLSRTKYLLISWFQSPSAVIVEPKKTRDEYNSWFLTSASHHMRICTIYLSTFFFLILNLFCFFVIVLSFLFSFFGCAVCGNLSFQAKDLTGTPALEVWRLNHCTTREVPLIHFLNTSESSPPQIILQWISSHISLWRLYLYLSLSTARFPFKAAALIYTSICSF